MNKCKIETLKAVQEHEDSDCNVWAYWEQEFTMTNKQKLHRRESEIFAHNWYLENELFPYIEQLEQLLANSNYNTS